MWTVISEMGPDGPEYIVVNKQTSERRGSFDCEQWAREMANELTREEIDGIKRTDRKDLGTI